MKLAWLSLLLVTSGVAHADEALEAIREQWRTHALDDAHYRTTMLAAVKHKRTAALWRAGFELGKHPALHDHVRLRSDDHYVEYGVNWATITTRFRGLRTPPPEHCSFGCCTYPTKSAQPSVSRACFDKRAW